MATSTIDATTSFVVLDRRERDRGRDREERDGPSAAPGPSSATGLERRWWTNRLEHALRMDQFVLHFQPIVSIEGGEASHHEALLRLAGGARGELIAPARFLPAAERYGLLGEIDRMVLRKAIAVLAERSGGDPRIAVNLSAHSVTAAGTLDCIESELDRHGVDPERLVIEITERPAITDMGRARCFCEGLARLGCDVALDDFGVGFGSFRYIKHLTFRYLKIDGDFIRSLPGSPRDELVVRALVGVAKSMGKETIAEYVADGPTLSLLRELGVDYGQGYGIGRPLAAEKAFACAA